MCSLATIIVPQGSKLQFRVLIVHNKSQRKLRPENMWFKVILALAFLTAFSLPVEAEIRWMERLKRFVDAKLKLWRKTTNSNNNNKQQKRESTTGDAPSAVISSTVSNRDHNASMDKQELLSLFSSTCNGLSSLIPDSSSRRPILMESQSGYGFCDGFKGNPFDGTKCGICIQNHFGGDVNKTFIEPFLFTIQFGVDQKVPKAQLIMTGYSDDLHGIKFNLPYILLNGKNEYDMSGVSLKVGFVDNVKLKAIADVSYEIDSGQATGSAFVSLDLKACASVSDLCYDTLPLSRFEQRLEMSEARVKALESLGGAKEQVTSTGGKNNQEEYRSGIMMDRSGIMMDANTNTPQTEL